MPKDQSSLLEGVTVSVNGGPEVPASAVEEALRRGKGPRMRETAEDREERDRIMDATAQELLQFIERVEAYEVERTEAQDQIKAALAEAKSRGFDTKALRVILAERKADKDKLAELHAVLDVYRAALGM